LVGTIGSSQIGRALGAWRSTTGPGGRRLTEYAALAATVRSLLRDGRIPLGIRMPAERELAATLGISRTTVTAAYRDLRETGHLASRRGAGSWTTLPAGQRIGSSGQLESAEDRDVIDLAVAALPAPPELLAATRDALDDLPAYARGTGYFPAGLPSLRVAVADHFTRRGLPTQPEHILITSGVQHAVDLMLRLTVAPGQSVLVESPTYPNVLAALRAHRARIERYHLDPELGWDADAMAAALRSTRAAMAYLIPEFHNPTGHLMPADLRERLPAAAHAAGTELVVDESFVELAFEDEVPPPLATYDRHARVITVGGMTKPYWGGLRVGWIRAAAPVIARLAALRIAVDMAGPVLDQLVAVNLLRRGDAVIAKRRVELVQQRGALLAALADRLPGWRVRVPGGGVGLWVELDAPVSTALAHAALEHGVRVAPGPRFGIEGTLERFLRLPFTLPAAELTQAVVGLAAAAEDLDRARPAEAPASLVA
jgi:DNA-binding transcriptional MocR family regulator